MEETTALITAMGQSEKRMSEIIASQRERLRNFIRRRVADSGDAEDILQDVLFEFVVACRLPDSIEQAGAWLFRVARNRIIDRFRKKKELPFSSIDDESEYWLDLRLPVEDGPEAIFARTLLLEAIDAALGELPEAQRNVLIAHEIEGLSFKTMAQEYGVGVNTLLARKRSAVLHLRTRLQMFYDEIN